MAYVSLYRKWRPQTFEEVIGQEYVTRTLSNSLRSGNFAHAYLFTGPRGTGKTSTARILAKALNCEEGPTPNPCNHCRSCLEITEGTSVDVIEIDAASNNRVDDIRDLRDRVIFSPAAARMKVYVLDEAHMITIQAFNALLKLLEEPPSHVVFVLATTEPHKMPATILSRCQRYDFRSVPVAMMAAHLARVAEAEGIQASEGSLRLIARRARGSARDALVILEQATSYGDGVVDEAEVAGFLGLVEDEMLVGLGDCLAAGDASGAVALVERAYEEGRDLLQFTREAQEHFRRVFLLQHADLGPEDLEVDEGAYEGIRRQAQELPSDRTFHFILSLREAIREMQATSSARLVLEGALIGMARSELDASPEALSARLGRLEGEVDRLTRKHAGEAHAQAPLQPQAVPHREEKQTPVSTPTEATEYMPEASELAAESETEREPSPASEAETATLDLVAIRRAWPQVKDKVKQEKITTHAFLLEGKPLEFEGGELIIAFPADRSFHRGELDKEDHRRVLEEALEDVLGVKVKVRTRLDDGKKGPAREKAGGAKRGAKKEPPAAEPAQPETDSTGESEAAYGGEDTGADEVSPDMALGMPCGEPEPSAKKTAADGESVEMRDAGKIKLVKDVFGAEMIEEIKLGE